MSRGNVTVIGAGMVGICCASYLQRARYQVTVIDPLAPGSACSFGNAGVIAPGACLPLAMPGLWRQVPGFLLDPLGPLSIRWRDLAGSLPWLMDWLRTSSPARARQISAAMRSLHRPAFDCLEPLLRDAGAADFITRAGQLYVSSHRDTVLGSPLAVELLREAGVRTEHLGPDEVRQLEPTLAGVRSGLLFPDNGHSKNSYRVVQRLAEHFVQRGGTVVPDAVKGFDIASDDVTTVIGACGIYPAGTSVVAAGAWSDRLAGQLGTKVRMIAERGYHVTAADSGEMPNRVISHVDHRIAITPMDIGVRIGGTVEIADVDAPPNFARAKKLLEIGRAVLPGARLDNVTEWMGPRPSVPDGLPVIDRSPHLRNVIYAFGHSHYGFMGAAPTGRLVADLVSGETPFIDAKPFSLARLS
ncbi:NAD(P)/FAD-dependent oxidoreductase [Phreatobacter stygius]|uniref:FAD-dependent oxidoreductase n=1 Tax=Phreatobacter stygius TaxID=1940610 RepID=A0A4D7B2C1_9HYPH|nr:FAD-dependent oxidoreductase [Phreatobacter stygius]QCI65173.1 FAD-dependent oxidoreductase [Phreatobacter stygius]